MSEVTKRDLVAAARDQGYQRMSARLVDDWIAQGLLDHPERQPLGHGRGSAPALWPETQLELFLSLLQKRDEGAPIAALCNIPVWLWLWWGDEYAPLRQTRQALKTWAKAAGYPSLGRARNDMRSLMGNWGNSSARRQDRRALEEALYPMLCSGQVDEAVLLPLIEHVFDPMGSGMPRGPAGGQLTPDRYLTLLRARIEGIVHLDRFDDHHFEQARVVYLTTRYRYEQERPRLAQDSELGERFAASNASDVIMDACLDLVTLLGMLSIPPKEGMATK